MQNIDYWTRITSLYGSQTSPVVLCMQNNFKSRCFQSKNHRWRLETIETSKSGARHAVLQAQNHRIISLDCSQTPPVVLCMQNSAISIRITSLNGSLPSSVVYGCKTATFGPQYQVSIGPRHKLSFCACKTAWFAPQLLVSIGPSTLLLFMYAKQRLFDQKKTSLYGPQTSTVFLCMHNSVISTRITSLYGFQPSSVVSWIQKCDIMTRIAYLYVSHTSPVILCMQNSVISKRINSLYGSLLSSVDFGCKTVTLGPEYYISMRAIHYLWFCSFKTATLGPD